MDCLPHTARAKLLVLVFVLFPSVCEAREPWEFTDYALTGAALAALAVDWGQTRHVAKNPHRFDEKNPLLGAAPSVGKVDSYFVGAMLGTVALAHLLPRDYRRLFLTGALTVELSAIENNRAIGVKVEF